MNIKDIQSMRKNTKDMKTGTNETLRNLKIKKIRKKIGERNPDLLLLICITQIRIVTNYGSAPGMEV